MADTPTQQQLLLAREEELLAKKKTAIKTAGAALESSRKAEKDLRAAMDVLRGLGYGPRELTSAFDLTRTESLALFPRKPRTAKTPGSEAAAAPIHEGAETVDSPAQ